jgi:hypothetical protein
MLILACISGHGFGHGARTTAVLSELAARAPHWRLVLSTPLPTAFLQLCLGEIPFEHRPCRWDVGVVQADALGADAAATLTALQRMEEGLDAQIEREAAWLQQQGQPVLVLGDVPPAAARLAERIGAPLVWLASFGWDAIYAPMGGPFLAWAQHCRRQYERGNLLLRCPLALPIHWGIPEQQVGLTCGRPRLNTDQLRRRLNLPHERQRCVLVSFGGLGFALDPALLARWPDTVFIGPDPALAGVANGRVLPADARPLDLMPLVARVITKPGYSTFCEAFSQGVGLHLVQRHGFAEAAVLELELRRHGPHRLLSRQQFLEGDWQLDQPLHPALAGALASDGAAAAAQCLIRYAQQHWG